MISTKALIGLSPITTLAIAVSISVLGHGAFLLGLKPNTRAPVHRVLPPQKLSVRLLSERAAPLPPLVLERTPATPGEHRRNTSVTTGVSLDDAPQAPSSPFAPPVLAFEPALYLRPSDVDAVATPISEDSLELLQLTGTQPGLWVVRMYIGESGTVDELEVVDGRGSETNTLELLSLLRSVRFTPALAQGRPVRSQKMLEFSFEPGPMPLTPTLVPPPDPSPSAEGK